MYIVLLISCKAREFVNEGHGSCESGGLQGSDSGDLWNCLCDRDIAGNSGAGRSVEIWVFNEGCVRGESAFFADLWVEMQGAGGLLGAT